MQRAVKPLRLMPVGILGGGQLARMLAEAALRLGLQPVVLAKTAKDPAAKICRDTIIGELDNMAALRQFFARASFIIFENEFVSCDLLEKAGRETSFYPSLKTIRLFQDKLHQKEFLAKLKIPMAPFLTLEPDENSKIWISYLSEHFSGPCILKWTRLGYDGKGVFRLDHTRENLRQARRFCLAAQKLGIPVFAEAMIRFKRELAVIGCYSTKREFKAYPLVISEQEEGICTRVYGPAAALGVPSSLEKQAHAIARRIAEKADLFGCFGIEFFETEKGELLVNEIAPRVHNTGHYTMDASETGQFENHWRAVLGLPLGETQSKSSFFAMRNLIGPANVSLPEAAAVFPALTPPLHLHWYGKERISPRRKVGHLNGFAADRKGIQALLREMEACCRTWEKQLETIQK